MVEIFYRNLLVASNVKSVEKDGGWLIELNGPHGMPVGTELVLRESGTSPNNASSDLLVRVARAIESPPQMLLKPAEPTTTDASGETLEPVQSRRPKPKGKRK